MIDHRRTFAAAVFVALVVTLALSSVVSGCTPPKTPLAAICTTTEASGVALSLASRALRVGYVADLEAQWSATCSRLEGQAGHDCRARVLDETLARYREREDAAIKADLAQRASVEAFDRTCRGAP